MCTPSLAIDAIIEVPSNDDISVLLVHRGAPPEGFAIPGILLFRFDSNYNN